MSGVFSITVLKEMKSSNQVQILDKAVCILLHANYFWNDMNPYFLSQLF